MVHNHTRVSDEDRRAFLEALGVAGAVAVGGATLDEIRTATSASMSEELASIGSAIEADLAGELDTGLIADQQAALAAAARDLPAVVDRGFPTDGPREEFGAVAAAGQPVYDHFTEVGFFESTTDHLPAFTPAYLESAIEAFAGSAALTAPLSALGLSDSESVDLLATVIGNADELAGYHWVATDEIPREQIEMGEFIPPMTMGAAGGTLLWLADLDLHLWQDQVLLTEDILADAAWYGQSMAAGFYLMAEGARALTTRESLSEGEVAALLSTGFAVQAIAQGLLPQHVYWITDEMRADGRFELEPA